MMKLGFILIFVTLFVVCILNYPSDEVLEQRFHSNKTEFEKLITMLNEDRDIVRLSFDNVFYKGESSHEVSEERLYEYRKLFKKLKLNAGIYRANESSVRLIIFKRGWLTNSEKSYLYSSIEPSIIVNSLDDIIKNDPGNRRLVHKKIQDNWYLYYESW
jgi:hypothetical protein